MKLRCSILLWFCCCTSDNDVAPDRELSPYEKRMQLELTQENLRKITPMTKQESLYDAIKKARIKAEILHRSLEEEQKE